MTARMPMTKEEIERFEILFPERRDNVVDMLVDTNDLLCSIACLLKIIALQNVEQR